MSTFSTLKCWYERGDCPSKPKGEQAHMLALVEDILTFLNLVLMIALYAMQLE